MVNKGESPVGVAEPEDPPVEEEQGDDGAPLKQAMDEIKKKEDDLFMAEYQDVKPEELIATGSVSHTVSFLGMEIVLRTITEDEDLAVSKQIYGTEGTAHFISESISRRILSHCIVSINGVEFGSDPEDRFKKIGKMGKAIKLKLYEELLDLNKAVAILVTGSSGNSLERLLTGRV